METLMAFLPLSSALSSTHIILILSFDPDGREKTGGIEFKAA